MADLEVWAGPFFYERGEGTLYAEDTDEIFDATRCKCSMRERGSYNGKRALTISGPASKVSKAKEMAEKAIQQNQSGPPINAQKGGADKRNENQARHADAERKRAQYKAPTTCKRKREDGQGWEGKTWSNWAGDEWSRYTPTQSDADAKWQTDAVPTTQAMTDHAFTQWSQSAATAHHWAGVYWDYHDGAKQAWDVYNKSSQSSYAGGSDQRWQPVPAVQQAQPPPAQSQAPPASPVAQRVKEQVYDAPHSRIGLCPPLNAWQKEIRLRDATAQKGGGVVVDPGLPAGWWASAQHVRPQAPPTLQQPAQQAHPPAQTTGAPVQQEQPPEPTGAPVQQDKSQAPSTDAPANTGAPAPTPNTGAPGPAETQAKDKDNSSEDSSYSPSDEEDNEEAKEKKSGPTNLVSDSSHSPLDEEDNEEAKVKKSGPTDLVSLSEDSLDDGDADQDNAREKDEEQNEEQADAETEEELQDEEQDEEEDEEQDEEQDDGNDDDLTIEYNIYTYGWHHMQCWTVRAVASYMRRVHGMDPSQTVFINACNFQQQAGWHNGTHIGSHEMIWESIVDSPLFEKELDGLYRRIKRVNGDSDGKSVNIVIFCKYGKHRSVALGTLLQKLMRIYVDNVNIRHLAFANWSRHGCGHKLCAECDAMTWKKRAILKRARAIFDSVFVGEDWFI